MCDMYACMCNRTHSHAYKHNDQYLDVIPMYMYMYTYTHTCPIIKCSHPSLIVVIYFCMYTNCPMTHFGMKEMTGVTHFNYLFLQGLGVGGGGGGGGGVVHLKHRQC